MPYELVRYPAMCAFNGIFSNGNSLFEVVHSQDYNNETRRPSIDKLPDKNQAEPPHGLVGMLQKRDSGEIIFVPYLPRVSKVEVREILDYDFRAMTGKDRKTKRNGNVSYKKDIHEVRQSSGKVEIQLKPDEQVFEVYDKSGHSLGSFFLKSRWFSFG
ncbi:hypothetical protein HYX08_04910 [Candidatus Woesearchaeota archaeon]|nr:hypothetical protein [Candidatus Woesearchaeota archaeon]